MWDLALDPDSGDLLFGPTHDLLGVTGTNLTDQRILTRCKIPRGTYTYDETGSLGSRLYTISGSPIERQAREGPALVQEALEPMADVNIDSIDVGLTDDDRVFMTVKYSPVVRADEGDVIQPDPSIAYSANVTI